MKKLMLSLALALGLSSLQGFYNPFVTNLLPGEAAAKALDTLSKEQATTFVRLMRALILCKHAPIWSTIGAIYGGAVGYTFFIMAERSMKYESPEKLAKISPRIRQLLKIVSTGSFALLGAWLSAYGWQARAVTDAALFGR